MDPATFTRDLDSVRTAKFIEMHRQLERAEARARDLEAQLAQGTVAPPPAPGGAESEASAGVVTDTPPSAEEPTGVVAPSVFAPAPDSPEAEMVASLRAELASERAERERLNTQLQQMQHETATGPFETSPEALQKARQEIEALQQALDRERQARAEIERQFKDLQVRAAQDPSTPLASENRSLREELATLKAQQAGLLAGIQADLDASRERERQLQAALSARDPESAVGHLSAANAALQARLDEEHRRNAELAAKLKVAMRVSDLIFRMQPAPAAGAW
jgi:DNA repair exonuclease SbcCD ATPase subunit